MLVYIILGFPPPLLFVCILNLFISVSLIVCVVVVLFVCCCCFCVCGFCVFSGSWFFLSVVVGHVCGFLFYLRAGEGGGGLRIKQDDKRQDHRE